jgi:hypothetical protein
MPTPNTVTTNTTLDSIFRVQVDVRSSLNFDAMWKAHPLNWTPEPDAHPFKKKIKVKKTLPRTVDDVVNDRPAKTIEEEIEMPLYEDQCGIKMSIALQEGGLPMATFKGATETHNVKQLNKKIRAGLRAEEIAGWLRSALAKPEELSPKEALLKLTGKRGIVFFKDFWQRDLPGGTSANPRRETLANRSGDHIDLWDGKTTPNTLPQFYTNGDTYFTRSKVVWFWELK